LPSTVLVGDDEADIISLTKTILEREGHLVTPIPQMVRRGFEKRRMTI